MDWKRLEDSVVHSNSVKSFKTLVAKARQLCTAKALLRCNNTRQLDATAHFHKNKNQRSYMGPAWPSSLLEEEEEEEIS